MTARMGDTEWQECLERLVDWANFLDLSPNKAFRRIAELLKEEHFGVEHIELDHWDDFEDPNEPPSMKYLNMGDTYATTLIVTDDYVNGVKLMVSCWGDWYETNERHHQVENGRIGCGYCGHHTPFDYEKDEWLNHECQFCHHNVSGGELVKKSAE